VQPAAILLALGLALSCTTNVFAQALAPAAGEVQLKLPGGGIYIGTVSNGVPDGKGYFQDADGTQYEGEVRLGQRTGAGEALFPSGDRYKGEWKNGKPDGIGTMTYMLGGAYEGRWRGGYPDGRGMMTYAGSGRRAEVGFVNGERIDGPPPTPIQEAPKARYAVRQAHPPIGSRLAHAIHTSEFPLDVGWEGLTLAQQRIIRDKYPALHAADEPPYPLKGPKALYARLGELIGEYDINEEVKINVLVGADGKVVSVTAIGFEHPDARRLAGTLVGLLPYKPARCDGKPCQMMVPFHLSMSVTH